MAKTPYTETGVRKFDDEDPVTAVILAWGVAGPYPKWHEARKQEVTEAMPVLARALNRLEQTFGR